MNAIRGSTSRKPGDDRCLALWMFAIQERKVCFWGRYSDAESTAHLYAQHYGLDSGSIKLLDATGHLYRPTTH